MTIGSKNLEVSGDLKKSTFFGGQDHTLDE